MLVEPPQGTLLDQVFKELYKRMNEHESRVGKLGDVRDTTLPSMIMIMGDMIVADPTTEARFQKEGCAGDFDRMKWEVEGLRGLYKSTRPIVPLGLSAFGGSGEPSV